MANKTPFEGGALVEAAAMLKPWGCIAKKWLIVPEIWRVQRERILCRQQRRLLMHSPGEWERMKEFGIKGVENMDDLCGS